MDKVTDWQETSDGTLILRLRQGDTSALAEIYERYKDRIYRTALAITRDPAAAEDVLQESFVRLFTHADRLRTDEPVGPWLYRVAVNLSVDWLSHRQRWFGLINRLMERWTAPLKVERIVEERELQEKVQHAIRTLPLAQQVVVVLYYLEGLSLKEIAEILEVPEGTVKSRLHYAREVLRERLTEWRPAVEMVYELT
ncbi:MAG: sigma-70 family RNA polymerase sigma factor [Thermoflexia bacterium]|nr:MAG: sigma-70 family RNA polymerase sigma factor [Thermoflexia bacterium]